MISRSDPIEGWETKEVGMTADEVERYRGALGTPGADLPEELVRNHIRVKQWRDRVGAGGHLTPEAIAIICLVSGCGAPKPATPEPVAPPARSAPDEMPQQSQYPRRTPFHKIPKGQGGFQAMVGNTWKPATMIGPFGEKWRVDVDGKEHRLAEADLKLGDD